jgi:hypothetical protein
LLVTLGYAHRASFEAQESNKRRITMKSMVCRPKGYDFAKAFHHMQFLKKGTTIAVHETGGEPPLIMHDDGYIIMPSRDAKWGDEWYYVGAQSASV